MDKHIVAPTRLNMAKLDWPKVREIRAASARGESTKSLCERFGLGPTQVRRIVSRKCWKE